MFEPHMAMRTCGYCGLKRAHMGLVLSDHQSVTARGSVLTHTILECPDCGRLTMLQTAKPHQARATIVRVIPDADDMKMDVKHLPEDVRNYYNDARRVLDAGVPDAAAVQLRRTLEAAAARFEVRERVLQRSIEKLIEQGLVTKQFGEAMHRIRAVGNMGAHAGDERVDEETAEQALNFTTQLLRNLFEVPGELELPNTDDAE
ncbi:hypothetical protein BH683_017670 [Williamsia sp. 1138]|uniref:DUF4145 domain-containing protein n=1 Tax=Williamsia sp. 1138 TaxID=1903117 RepID=UPI000A11665A|nr:DUF4145 domain-containing protein [Williamsia sp. 1138]OZG27700.1 hypothetical protein BH683_017670 [Williamsia sp. 1138]